MSRPQAEAEILVEDARTRATRFDFAPGAETGWHEHGHDYVIVALTDCDMALEEPDGRTRRASVEAGDAYRRDAGVRHNVVNAGDRPMRFVEIELLEPRRDAGDPSGGG